MADSLLAHLLYLIRCNCSEYPRGVGYVTSPKELEERLREKIVRDFTNVGKGAATYVRRCARKGCAGESPPLIKRTACVYLGRMSVMFARTYCEEPRALSARRDSRLERRPWHLCPGRNERDGILVPAILLRAGHAAGNVRSRRSRRPRLHGPASRSHNRIAAQSRSSIQRMARHDDGGGNGARYCLVAVARSQ